MLPVLNGRTPIQVYADYMRSFRERFNDYLGDVIVVRLLLYNHITNIIYFNRRLPTNLPNSKATVTEKNKHKL